MTRKHPNWLSTDAIFFSFFWSMFDPPLVGSADVETNLEGWLTLLDEVWPAVQFISTGDCTE